MTLIIALEGHFKMKYLGKPKLKGVEDSEKVFCINSSGLPKINMLEVYAKLDKRSTFMYFYKTQSGNFTPN